MKISIALAAYNCEKYICKQLDSIVGQTKLPTEVIIIDDCSSDNTFDLCLQYKKKYSNINFTVQKNDKNIGYFNNFSKAINMATGDIIFLSDQDDIWELNKIEKMTYAFNNNDKIKLVACNYDFIDEYDKYICKHELPCNEGILDNARYLKSLALAGATFAFRKELIDDYNNAINNISDIKYHDLLLGIIAIKHGSIYLVNKIYNHYRMHDNNAIGVNGIKNKTKENRVKWLANLINTEYIAINILKHFKMLHELKFLENVVNTNNIRFSFLKNGFIAPELMLLFKIKYLPSYKSIIGDIIYRITYKGDGV